jgi:glutathione-regulated potassium-efflux system ancillary protein KefG
MAGAGFPRVLLLFAHPAFERSRVHRRLAHAVRDLEQVTFHDLYELYPDFDVDVAREQELLVGHDLHVLQHPFHWYGPPPLVKQWLDLVLEAGWAYGPGGTALRGKRLLVALSAGGSESSYASGGYNRHTVAELLAPLAQTFRLCGADFLPPFVVFGTQSMGEAELERAADDYRRVVTALRDGRLDVEAGRRRGRIDVESDLASSAD